MLKKIIIILLISLAINYLYANELPQAWSKPEGLIQLNSNRDEFAPSYNHSENRLYFNSNISGKSQLYWVDLQDIESSKPILAKGLLNNPAENRSYFSFSDDGTVYLSAFRRTNKYPFVNIAQSSIQRNAYSEPIFIESLSHNSFNGQATVSPNGSVMVFASDRINGKTTDLFISYKDESGVWSEPIELSELNSDGNEITPFFYSDSLLFFSSDGLSGIGGYDIYKTEYYNGIWQVPIPLNDINTEFDESDFIILPDGTAIFSSNRGGSKVGLDLYIAKPTVAESIETEEYSFHLSLKSSPAEIRLNQEVKYSIFNLNGIFPINYDYFKICDSLYTMANSLEFNFISNSPLDFLFHIKIEQAKQEKAKIIISVNDKLVDSDFLDRVSRFADYLNFPQNLIEIRRVSEIDERHFKIETANPFVWLSKSTYSFASSNIQLIADCQPQPSGFTLNLRTKHGTADSGFASLKDCQFPAEYTLNLANILSQIPNRDELMILADLDIEKSIMTPLSVYLNLPIITTISKEPYSVSQQGKKQIYYFIKLPDNSNGEPIEEQNKPILDILSENFSVAKSIKYKALSSGKEGSGELLRLLTSLDKYKRKLQIQELATSPINYSMQGYALVIVEL